MPTNEKSSTQSAVCPRSPAAHLKPRTRRGIKKLRKPSGMTGGPSRRGIATIWGVASMGMLLTVGALVVDGALLYNSHGDLQVAADSGALAGASMLSIDPSLAKERAIEYASKNFANGSSVTLTESNIELGDWNADTRVFTPLSGEDEVDADAVRVTAGLTEAGGNPVSMAFAQVFGVAATDVVAEAIAVYRPRDIVLVLDLSGSMSFDSQIGHIPYLGRDAIEANLYQIWQELGSVTYGNMGFETQYISSDYDWWVMEQLGLNDIPYPYARGSWNDYVNYVQGNNVLGHYGYRKDYGGLTFMNYLLSRRGRHSHTPELAGVSAQPITAVKDSVDIFLDFIHDVATEDRVGLAVYTAGDGTAKIEQSLTHDTDIVRNISRARQAGHYHGMTNIGAGILKGRQELENNGRPNTLKTIVLLTDGVANLPGSSSEARSYALQQAQYAADAGYNIAAISLGAKVDAQLMSDIAQITGGIHYHVPGGQPVAAYEEDLIEVFRHIARERPLQLVN